MQICMSTDQWWGYRHGWMGAGSGEWGWGAPLKGGRGIGTPPLLYWFHRFFGVKRQKTLGAKRRENFLCTIFIKKCRDGSLNPPPSPQGRGTLSSTAFPTFPSTLGMGQAFTESQGGGGSGPPLHLHCWRKASKKNFAHVLY